MVTNELQLAKNIHGTYLTVVERREQDRREGEGGVEGMKRLGAGRN